METQVENPKKTWQEPAIKSLLISGGAVNNSTENTGGTES
jgi:hypothetical protein